MTAFKIKMLPAQVWLQPARWLKQSFVRKPKCAAAIFLGGLCASSVAVGGFPEAVERAGRLCGAGYGDGYHACYSSGMRPLANLPPRTYPARVGSMDEKINGCATCRPKRLPGVDPIRSQHPETFYHRFDRYADQVSHQESHMNSAWQAERPVQSLVDPERYLAPTYSQLDPKPNMREYEHRRPTSHGSPLANFHPHSQTDDDTATADGEPAAPPISEKEMEEFRKFQEAQEQRKKFHKYMIDPDRIEPNQIIGGPPVGSQQRRKIDEAKVNELKEKIRRELAQDERTSDSEHRLDLDSDAFTPMTNDFESSEDESLMAEEDDLLSPSDRKSPSVLDLDDDMPLSMDELLPPFPSQDASSDDNRLPESIPAPEPSMDSDSLLDSPLDPSPTPRSPLDAAPESNWSDSLDSSDSIKPLPMQQTSNDHDSPLFASPMLTGPIRPWASQTTEIATDDGPQFRDLTPSSDLTRPSDLTHPSDLTQSTEPAHRVAEAPRKNHIPESWRFIKQPR